jgi:hypothetical protein
MSGAAKTGVSTANTIMIIINALIRPKIDFLVILDYSLKFRQLDYIKVAYEIKL